MTEFFTNLGLVCGALVSVIGALYVIRKFWRALFPIKIKPETTISFTEEILDSINAVVTNRSEDVVYITECYAQEVRPLTQAIIGHLRRPFLRPSMYPCLWWGANRYPLLHEHQLKLEPGETIKFKHQLNFNIPFLCFLEHEFKVIVKLSTGRTVVSHRLDVPDRWHIFFVRSNA